MAMSSEAQAVKQEMTTAIVLRRELEQLETEWHELIVLLEEQGEGAEFDVLHGLSEQREALRRQVCAAQVRNWARISGGDLTPLQRRILGLRYVRGCTWSDVIRRIGKVRQYLFREHNKALERLVSAELKSIQKNSLK